MNARVPLLAMVPRWSTIVARSMPMPLSRTVSVPAASSGISLIFQSLLPSRSAVLVSDSNRTLSIASAALLISSRRKISFLV